MASITFGDANSGFQAGIINGPVSTEFHQHHPPAPPVIYDSGGYFANGVLGQGTFGMVASVSHRDRPGSISARKQIRKSDIDYSVLQNEVQLVRQSEHRHVIKIVGDYQDDLNFYIVMEPVATSDLQQYLREMSPNASRSLSPEVFTQRRLQLFQFTRCLVSTLHEIHGRGIRHRDIKPQNILIHDEKIYLTDFGTSFATEEATRAGFTRTWGTDKYEPPEAFSGQQHGASIGMKNRTGRSGDIFSLGCVIFEILDALSVHANFPHITNNYAMHVVNKTFVSEVLAIKENASLVSKKLGEEAALPGLVQKMLKLVMNDLMVQCVEERGNTNSTLEVINQIYKDYPLLRLGCCAADN